MKAVIAIDSLKGSLSSMEAGYAAADGIRRVHGQDAEIIVRPLADGGEGTVEALVSGMNGIIQNVMVTGPLGTPVNCEYAPNPIVPSSIPGLELGRKGTIAVNENMQSSIPTIYAGGDIVDRKSVG